MKRVIHLDDKEVIIKRYRVRTTGKQGSTIETTIPKEAFEREARRLGLTFANALEKLVAVWRFNDFRGLHLSFEPLREEKMGPRRDRKPKPPVSRRAVCART